ncbi:hypothetical protein ONZ51_g7684 [Trametes cubensis]|uniref:Uncharacterized protein n=1 Tax=Trametes cubensis TaxID=1111947 RepID=A0AAD7TQ33_9APHY|nr:hypothetical protein ONZ51_g7684 [Trametes cubensis]
MTWKWTDAAVACRIDVDSNNDLCACREYQPIEIRQTCNLEPQGSSYQLSEAISYTGPNARVVNLTGRLVDIGAGFATDLGKDEEYVRPVMVYRRVANSLGVSVNYTPVLKVWATAEYDERQLITGNISSLPELWSGDLSTITGPDVPLIVSRDKSTGKITVTLQGSATPPLPDAPRPQVCAGTLTLRHVLAAHMPPLWPQTVFKADLAFAAPELVADGVRAIGNLLINKGYSLKTFSKAGSNTEIHIDLTLPQNVNCNEAELHVLAALQASPTVHGKAFIKDRSGVTLLNSSPGLESWAEINPASPQWYGI